MRSESETMTVEKGYKVTEVGVIPEEWEVTSLESICEVLDSRRKPIKTSDRIPGGYPYYGASGIIDWVDGFLFDEDLILLGEDGENIRSRNQPLAFRVSGKCWINNHAHVLRISDLTRDSIGFITLALESRDYSKLVAGSAQPKITQQQCRGIVLQRPPLPEQEKIAEVLSTVDEHIGETEDLIEKTETLKKGMMQQLLTRGIGHTEFKDTEIGRIPVEWDVVSIAHLGTVSKGKGVNRDSIQSEGFPCVRYGEIYTTYDYVVRKCYSYISDETAAMSTPIRMGDLLFTGSGETVEDIGKAVAYMLDQPGYAGGDILILHPNSSLVVPLFLSFQWDTQIVRLQRRRSGQGASIVHLYPDALKRIQVALPPLSEQRQIASILTTIDDRIEEHRSKLEALTQLKSGLMQQLLTGRIRVKL